MALQVYLFDGFSGEEYDLPETREIIVGSGPFKQAAEGVTASGRGFVEVKSPENFVHRQRWKSVQKHHCVLTRYDIGEDVEEVDEDRFLSVRDHVGAAEFRLEGGVSISNCGGVGDTLVMGNYSLEVRLRYS